MLKKAFFNIKKRRREVKTNKTSLNYLETIFGGVSIVMYSTIAAKSQGVNLIFVESKQKKEAYCF